jgi:MFS transporter, FHS family, glucose/mannose:H+ symporter
MNALIKTHAALLITGLVSFVLMGAGQSLYGPALPAFARDLQLSDAQAGWLVSAHWIGCIIGVAGMFRIGTHITPRIALGLMAAGAALIASTPGWVGTLAGAVTFGMGYGCATVVFNPRVLSAFGDKGPSMLSLLNAIFSLGAIAAPLVFVALGSSPSLAFGIVAAGCAVICLGAGAAGKTEAASAVASAPYKLHWGILLFGMVGVGLEACLIGLGPTALIKAGETEADAAELLSMFFVAFLLARIVLVFAAHYVASFTLYTLGMAGAALAALAAALLNPAVSFVVIGASAALFFPSFFVTAARKMGTDARVPATIVAAGLVGGILSPVIMSNITAGLGERGFFWITAGVASITAAAAFALVRPMNR